MHLIQLLIERPYMLVCRVRNRCCFCVERSQHVVVYLMLG